jgi:hypothetical protein
MTRRRDGKPGQGPIHERAIDGPGLFEKFAYRPAELLKAAAILSTANY